MRTDKYDEEWLEREFIGYGYNTPDPKWPGGAKVCVSFVVQFYGGAELNVLDGDAYSTSELLENPKKTIVAGRHENIEMQYEFGSREGVPRLLKLFDRYKVPATWNIHTLALTKSSYWLKPLLASGVELSCGGERFRNNFDLPADVEDRSIQTALKTMREMTGKAPEGWMVDKRSNMSVKLYARAHEEAGEPLLYSSDSVADDLPYWRPSPADKSKGLLMVPFSYDTSDFRFAAHGSGWASPKDYFLYLRDTFDCLYDEAEDGEGKMMTVILHPHLIGHGGRLYWLEEFVKYITSRQNVWVARRRDIAEHWIKTFPYDPKTAFGQTKVAECGQI